MLPNLIMPGAQKSATTTAAEILASHRDVCPGTAKEPHFFSIDTIFSGGVSRYESFYPDYSGQKYVLDASQSYLPAKFVPARIKETLGADLKFIIILRNPVDRATSGFAHVKDDPERGEMNAKLANILPPDLDKIGLDSLIAFEEKRTRNLMSGAGFETFNPTWDSYLFPFNFFFISRYSTQIENYLKEFPRENVLFCKFETASQDQEELKRQFADFLDIDPAGFEASGEVRKNVSARYKKPGLEKAGRVSGIVDRILPAPIARKLKDTAKNALLSKPEKFDAPTHHRLVEIFSEEIDRTAELTGLDLSSWKA